MDEGKVDLDKLAYAVAMAETADCTTGIGPRTNNCFGIMHWPNGVRTPKTYASKEEAYEDFKRIWTRGYGGVMPGMAAAQTWTGGDKPQAWLNIVHTYYNQ